jgi:hypothetical protein
MTISERSDPITIDERWDYLARGVPQGIEVPAEVKPSKKCALVATVRDEGIILLEWIAHNRLLGFDKLFIYSNDNVDGSEDLLNALHRAGIIHLTWNVAAPGVKVQLKAYRHAVWFQPELWDHEWVAFLDADEFVFPTFDGGIASVTQYLDHVESKYDCAQVSLNWRWFPGSLEFSRQPGLLFEKFPTSWWHNCVKSFSKLRLIHDLNAHYSFLKDVATSINCHGEKWTPNNSMNPKILSPKLGQVNHYWNRSFEEFYLRIRRGLPSSGGFHDWSTFYRFWGKAHEVSPYPNANHITLVKREVSELLALPDVQAAVNKIEARFAVVVSDPSVKDLYEQTLRKRDEDQ